MKASMQSALKRFFTDSVPRSIRHFFAQFFSHFFPHFFQRWLPPVAVPVVLPLAWFVAPLVGGGRTLFLRDVLQTHLADRIGLATSLRQLELPLIPLVDPLRAGGQALAGNLNALPFYPDNLLLLLAWPGAAGAAGRAPSAVSARSPARIAVPGGARPRCQEPSPASPRAGHPGRRDGPRRCGSGGSPASRGPGRGPGCDAG